MKSFKMPTVIALSIGMGVLLNIVFEKFVAKQNAENQICMNFSAEPFSGSNLDSVRSDLSRYIGTHELAVEAQMRLNGINKRASRSCTFPLDTIKKFIYYLEKHASKHNVRSTDLAIGFHYGVYPKKMITPNGQDYGSLHTLFLIPAKYDPVTQNYFNYDPINNKDLSYYYDVKAWNAIILRIYESITSRAIMVSPSTPPIQEPMAKNQGGLCPPRCPSTSITSSSKGY